MRETLQELEDGIIEKTLRTVNKTFPFMEFPLSISRQGNFPIDRKSLWWSKADADNYAATDPTAYVGMPISVHDEIKNTVTLYIINSDLELQEVGKAPLLDGKSIVLNEDGAIEIKGIKNALAGKILAVGVGGTIEFIDSQASNVEQIKERLEQIQETLANKAESVHGHAATDIVEDITHRFVTDVEKEAWNNKAETTDITDAIDAIPDASTTLKGFMTPAQVSGMEQMARDLVQAQEDIASFKTGEGLPLASNEANGIIIAADYKLLHDLEAKMPTKAEKEHTHKATDILEDETHRFVTDAEKAKWDDKYTKNEIDNKFNTYTTGMDWKEAVATFDDIATTYPEPEDGWTVNVLDTDITYRYTGTEWISISANSIPKATSEVDGKMSKEDYALLHKTASDVQTKADAEHMHNPEDILEDETHRFTTDTEKETWNQASTDATYAKNKADSNKTKLDTLREDLTALETKTRLATDEEIKALINTYIVGAFPEV